MILDNRRRHQNMSVSHSIFTRKFKTGGDEYERIVEAPTFGHSDNHAGIQLADILCSALLFPMASAAYCDGQIQNVHVSPRYHQLVEHFGQRIRELQHRYQRPDGKWVGGITVSDRLTKRPGALLFGS